MTNSVYTKEDRMWDGTYYFAIGAILASIVLAPYVMWSTKDKSMKSENGK